MKENDWLLNTLSNPTFGISDFKNVGLTVDNTSLEQEDTYKNMPFIQEMEEFQTDGEFDENKFHQQYLAAAYMYNNFTDDSYNEEVSKQLSYHRDNIFADIDQRVFAPEILFERTPNPLRESSGTIKLGKVFDNALSSREIAQKERVLLNPVEYEKGAAPKWGDAPNDSFFDDFFETRVLAQWDSDGEHVDLVTGKKIKHKKGDLKLNERGTVFYENLQGRDIYDKQVLSKLDIITTDGSKWNKYDFFDSDDKDKSYIGSIAKVAATLLPLATPIAPYYAGLGVALQTAKLGSTLGKIFLGNDNKTLSSIEGFISSVSPSVSDASMEQVWTVENMLNLVGDTFLQLQQQRWLFKYGPALLKGTEPISSKEAYNKQLQKYLDIYDKQNLSKLRDYIRNKGVSGIMDLENIKRIKAQNDMDKFMESYNNIGKYLSRAYMTGITTADAYGDAIRQGATDTEAALLTLGYTAAEYALMSTALGERVLPELRQSRYQYRNLQQKLVDLRKNTITSKNGIATKQNKYNWFQKLYKLGYDAATAAKTVAPSTFSTLSANALGEGIEETTEELLYDFTKSVYNAIQYLRGEKQISAWDNVLDRYGMSFIGGMLGGGLMELDQGLKNARNLPEFTSQSAMQEMVKIVRNNETEAFLKTLNKNTLGNKELSMELIKDNDNNYIYAPATDGKISQDEFAKQQIRNMVTYIQQILDSEGAKITDEELIDRLTRRDLKFSALQNSATAASYIQKFNSLVSDYSKIASDYNKFVNGRTDDQKKNDANDPEYQKQVSNFEKKLKDIEIQLQEYTSGNISPDFIKQGVFEMSYAIRNVYQTAADKKSFIEATSGKRIEDLDEVTINNLSGQWEQYKNGKMKDDLMVAYKIHEYISQIFSKYLQDHDLKYFQNTDENAIKLIQTIDNIILGKYTDHTNQNLGVNTIFDTTGFLKAADIMASPQESILLFNNIISKYGTPEDIQIIQQAIQSTEQNPELEKKAEDTILKVVTPVIEDAVNSYIQQGYINPEVKRTLVKAIDDLAFRYDDKNDNDKYDTLIALKNKLYTLQHSNMQELLEQFNLILGSNVKISDTLKSIQEAFLSGNAEDFTLPSDIDESIDSALSVVNLLEAQILSARVDQADVDNILGLNKTINEIDPELKLVELGSREADTMLFDLNLIKQRLKFAKNLINVNSGQKIAEQDMTAGKIHLITYKKFKSIQLPDDWDRSDWDTTLSQLTETNGLLSKLENKLNQEERIKLKTESQLLDRAIYNLFQKNKDKLDNPESMKKFMENFNLLDSTKSKLDSNITKLNDTHLFWYFITRAAVNPDDFYYAYKQVISDKIAPFYSQELATYTAFANIINRELFQKASQVYNERVAEQIRNLPDDKLRTYEVSKEYPYSSSYSATNSLITFIQGMPGTGKSDGVFRNIVNLLKITNPELLKKVWVVHATTESAEKLAKSLGLENYVAMNKESYMKKIAPQWSETFDEQGNLVINDNDITRDDQFVYSSTLDISQSNEASLIIADEFSRHSFIDADLQTKYSKLHNVPIIAAGDLQQSKVSGVVKEDIDTIYEGKKSVLTVTQKLEINDHNFVTSPPLGVLIRATSDVMVRSINSLSEKFQRLQDGETIPEVEAFHTIVPEGPNKGVYGVQIHDSDEMEDIMSDIDIMFDTLPPTEKIGYVYNDTESELYKVLTTNPKYSSRIEKLKGTSAQGLEAKYYIVEDFITTYKNESGIDVANWNKYYNDLYTVLTRSKQGCVWVKQLPIYNTTITSQEIENDNPPVRKLSADAIKAYSEERKSYLDEHYSEGNLESLKIKSLPKQSKPVSKKSDSNKDAEEPEILDSEGNSDGLNTDTQQQDKASKSQINLGTPKKVNPVIKTTVTGTEFNLLMSSTFSRETGFVTDSSGNLVPPSNFDKRLDNLNGLNKLLPNTGTSDQEYIQNQKEFLETLRYVCYTTKDRKELAQRLNNLLGLNIKDPYVQFFVKSNAKRAKDTNTKYYKEEGELLESIYSTASKANNHHNRTLSIVFGSESEGDKLELTLLTFPNIASILKNDEFKSTRERYDQLLIQNNGKIYDTLVQLRGELKTSSSQGAKQLVELIDMFEFTSNGAFFINHALPEWTIANSSTTYGIRVINQNKGLDYNTSGYENNKAEWWDLNKFKSDSTFQISDKVYMAPKGTIEYGGKTIKFAEPGNPFVLVSEIPKDLLKEDLFDIYIRELDEFGYSPSVTLVNLVTPNASIETYLSNIKNILAKKGQIRQIGNDFTAYRLLSFLRNDPRTKWDEVSKEQVFEVLDKLDKLKDDRDAQLQELETKISPSETKLGGKSVKLKRLLQAVLYNMTYQNNTPTENLSILKDIMKKHNWKGIYYNSTYNKAAESSLGAIIETISDEGSYSIDGNPFFINGKLDKSGYYINMAPILELISKKINKTGEIPTSSDNIQYEAGFSNKAPEIKETINDKFLNNSFKVDKKTKQFIQNSKVSTDEELIQVLNKNGNLVFTINNKYLVTPQIKNQGFNVNDFSSIQIEPIDISKSDILTYKVLADDDIYIATITLQGNTPKDITLSKQISVDKTYQPINFSDIDSQIGSLQDIEEINTVFNTLYDLFDGYIDSSIIYEEDPEGFWNMLINDAYKGFMEDNSEQDYNNLINDQPKDSIVRQILEKLKQVEPTQVNDDLNNLCNNIYIKF